MKDVKVIAGMLIACLVFSPTAWGQASEGDAKKKVEPLTPAEIEAFRKYLAEKDGKAGADGAKGGKRFSVWSNLEIQIYGHIKLDAAYDTSRTNTGDFTRWVASEGVNKDDDQFNMTANETRLGLRIKAPDEDNIKTSGRLEIDFYGAAGAENRPQPMMRHAYMLLEFPESGTSVLAGQTSDVISPLVPYTLNYVVQWWGGNIGYRRPQIRVTKDFDLGGEETVQVQAALARAIGHASGFDPGDTGEDAGLPGLQVRAAATLPVIDGRKATVGVSGHYQPEEYDTNASGRNTTLCSWSANVDILLPVAERVTLKGEAFVGQNLDAFLGGIGQGIDVGGGKISEIRSAGGWAAATVAPEGPWKFNVGAGGEIVNEDDVTTAAFRTSNSSVFANAVYKITENASIGAEVSNWYTQYKRMDSGQSVRFQLSFIYAF